MDDPTETNFDETDENVKISHKAADWIFVRNVGLAVYVVKADAFGYVLGGGG